MQLGAFSVSLSVQDLAASQAFYEKLGFSQVGGDAAQNWVILRNGTTTIGLFHGMFPDNVLTFNPGWSPTCDTLGDFQDVRQIQAALTDQGVELTQRADPDGDGPAHIALVDPDGNPILIDQHVPSPGS
jgi:catechol 2,3-dioxygenase-like lactoylglutathione lyase family enzyme